MAMPAVAISQTTDVERVEMAVDLNAAEEQYRLARSMGINVGHYAVEFSHELGSPLRKRNTPICSTDCGQPSTQNCIALLKSMDNLPLDVQFCANNNVAFFYLNDCTFTLSDLNNKPVCLSQGRFNAVAKEVFNHCSTNPVFGFGGCYDLEGPGHLCVRNFEIQDANTCV